MGAIPGCADSGTLKAAQLLDVEMEKLSGSRTLLADDGRLGSLEGGEPA